MQILFNRYCVPLLTIIIAIGIFTFAVIALTVGKCPELLPRQVRPPLQIAHNLRRSTVGDDLFARLPVFSQAIAATLHRIAAAEKINLDEVSYETTPEQGLPVVRQTASFSLSDNYGSIRHYLDEVLQAQPNATLESLQCTREDIASNEVDCSIVLAAYMQQAVSKAAAL